MSFRFGIVLVLLGFAGACVPEDSNTDLNPDGPPELAQVRLVEAYTDSSGAAETRRVFAYGTLPMATADEEHAVTTANSTSQSIRVIMDELLKGNHLQQIDCRAAVGLDDEGQSTTFSDVPDGSTPDDIAKCAVSDAALPLSCIGDHLTCLCQLDGGCDGVAKGSPVGVLDDNADGAADITRFKEHSVEITCGPAGPARIEVPLDLDMSYWNPSGDQQVPAAGGFDALGPAIVLIPLGGILPTNITCGLTFAADVVDDSDIQVCAIPGGRPADCTGRLADCPAFSAGCTPGDTSAFSFGVQALTITSPVPEGATGISLTAPLFFNASAPLLLSSIAGITITPAVPDVQITLSSATSVQFVFPTGLAPSTMYTFTFPTTVTDTFGQGLPAPFVLHFTTAAM